ncbi:FAD-binding protein [Paradesulfitobacterium aromaticivorans]
MNKILLYGDDLTRLRNLTVYGRRLAEETGASLVTAVVRPYAEQMAKQVVSFGSDVVVVIDVPENAYFAETIVENLLRIYNEEKPDAIFLSSTFLGREIAPRLATKLKTGCITECSNVAINENGQLVAERLVFGGIAASRLVITKAPQVFTVTFDTDASITLEEKSKPEIIKREYAESKVSKRITGKAKIEKSIDLASAENIVSVGRGFNSEKDIELIRPLLEHLNAELGCSRPIAEDFRWLPVERLVGLTGTVVKPKLYLAIGISGQIQHQVGMKNSKLIIAINNNPQAPIFEIADYGVVGDLYEVVPKLVERIARF